MNKVGFPCPCCGYLTISSEPPGTYEICPVCNWEDDIAQHNNPTLRGGANIVSLQEARQNYLKLGAICEQARKWTREPYEDELP